MYVHVTLGYEVIYLLSSFGLILHISVRIIMTMRLGFQGFLPKALSQSSYSWNFLQSFQDKSMVSNLPITSGRQKKNWINVPCGSNIFLKAGEHIKIPCGFSERIRLKGVIINLNLFNIAWFSKGHNQISYGRQIHTKRKFPVTSMNLFAWSWLLLMHII